MRDQGPPGLSALAEGTFGEGLPRVRAMPGRAGFAPGGNACRQCPAVRLPGRGKKVSGPAFAGPVRTRAGARALSGPARGANAPVTEASAAVISKACAT